MNKADVKLAKSKILKCLTEDFEYGKRKDGKPLKHKIKNQAIFDKIKGYAIYNGTDLEMVMDKVILGLYFSLEDRENYLQLQSLHLSHDK